jgi:hypothetical protein
MSRCALRLPVPNAAEITHTTGNSANATARSATTWRQPVSRNQRPGCASGRRRRPAVPALGGERIGRWVASPGIGAHRISSSCLVYRKLNAEIAATITKITTASADAKP